MVLWRMVGPQRRMNRHRQVSKRAGSLCLTISIRQQVPISTSTRPLTRPYTLKAAPILRDRGRRQTRRISQWLPLAVARLSSSNGGQRGRIIHCHRPLARITPSMIPTQLLIPPTMADPRMSRVSRMLPQNGPASSLPEVLRGPWYLRRRQLLHCRHHMPLPVNLIHIGSRKCQS